MQFGAVLVATVSSRVEKLKETVSENSWIMGEDRRDVFTFFNVLLDRQTANGQNCGAAWRNHWNDVVGFPRSGVVDMTQGRPLDVF